MTDAGLFICRGHINRGGIRKRHRGRVRVHTIIGSMLYLEPHSAPFEEKEPGEMEMILFNDMCKHGFYFCAAGVVVPEQKQAEKHELNFKPPTFRPTSLFCGVACVFCL